MLVADDDAANRHLMVTRLRRPGYEALAVQDGHAVLRAVEQSPWDIILMDCRMPEMDGFAATRAIRERETSTGRRVPTVALTASNTADDHESCLAIGMDDYLTKPIKGPLLEAMLARWLGMR